MARADLEQLPQFRPPPDFTLRPYHPGDDQSWYRIQVEAETLIRISHEHFHRQFHRYHRDLAQRQVYLCHGEHPVGTATAWYDDIGHDPQTGRVHWVAIVPQFQGRGLAKPLLWSVCRRLQEAGHTRAYLTTSTARLPAISLYHRFGFRPEPRTEEEAAAWRQVANRLGWPQS